MSRDKLVNICLFLLAVCSLMHSCMIGVDVWTIDRLARQAGLVR